MQYCECTNDFVNAIIDDISIPLKYANTTLTNMNSLITLSVSRNLWKTIPRRSSENTPTWLTSPNRKWLIPILLNTIAVRLFRSI